MRRCCIVGGGGFVGLNLARHLVRTGKEVVSYGRPSISGIRENGVRYIPGEFADISALRLAIEGCETVFHLVGGTPARTETDRAGDVQGTVVSTLCLLDAGAAGAFGKIVFVSSGGTVYGLPESLPISETARQWPTCSYGVSKMAVERYLHVYNHIYGLRYGIARVSNPYGPHQRSASGQGAIAALLDCALTGRPFTIVGDGTAVRDYFYVEDLVEALTRIADHEGVDRIFNIGSGIGIGLNDLVDLVEGVTGCTIERLYKPGRAIDVPINILDVRRAADELGWFASTPMQTGLAQTFDWMADRNMRDMHRRSA